MEFIDARRLTGPSLLFDVPGTILDVACSAEKAALLAPVWEKHVRRMLGEIGWQDCEFASLELTGGISLGFTAPIDALYAASEINEWAWAVCNAELNGGEAPDFDEAVAATRAAIAEEANPELMQLCTLAAEKGVTLLWDDDDVSWATDAIRRPGRFANCRTRTPSTGAHFVTCRRVLSPVPMARQQRFELQHTSCVLPGTTLD